MYSITENKSLSTPPGSKSLYVAHSCIGFALGGSSFIVNFGRVTIDLNPIVSVFCCKT